MNTIPAAKPANALVNTVVTVAFSMSGAIKSNITSNTGSNAANKPFNIRSPKINTLFHLAVCSSLAPTAPFNNANAPTIKPTTAIIAVNPKPNVSNCCFNPLTALPALPNGPGNAPNLSANSLFWKLTLSNLSLVSSSSFLNLPSDKSSPAASAC